MKMLRLRDRKLVLGSMTRVHVFNNTFPVLYLLYETEHRRAVKHGWTLESDCPSSDLGCATNKLC